MTKTQFNSGAYYKWPKQCLNVLPTTNDQTKVYKYCLPQMAKTKFKSIAYYKLPKQSLQVLPTKSDQTKVSK